MLDKQCSIVLKQCMALKKSESCLVVTDKKLLKIGKSLLSNALKISKNSKLILTEIPKNHGTEPPKRIADEMLNYDVILCPTSKSLTHTRAATKARKKGARIATMPGITIDMMKRTLNVNFRKIRALNNRLISKLRNKNKIVITTNKGTKLVFYARGRKWVSDDGIYSKKHSLGNLPAGEIFIAPNENRTNGVLVADASIGSLGKIKKDIRIEIKDGFLTKISGSKLAEEFEESLKEKMYRNVAELGIGTNCKARITGNVLEDEKVYGTFHVAFGNSKHFGGKIDVPFHVDFVIKKPTIWADDELIMKDDKTIYL